MRHAAWWMLILVLAFVPAWAPDGSGGSEPFGQPFTKEIPIALAAGVLAGEGTPFTVPANKLLIIEFVMVAAAIEAGASNNAFASIRTTLGGQPHEHYLLMSKQGNFGADLFVGNHPVRIYAEAGSQVGCFFGRNNALGFPVAGTATVTGRLISQ